MWVETVNELIREHLDTLGLADREPPDLYLSARDIGGAPHAAAMRLAFESLGLSGFLCIQQSPTVAFLVQEKDDVSEVDRVHKALWNQGLASLLLVLRHSELLAYSLMRKPVEKGRHSEGPRDPRLVEILKLTTRGLEAFQLIAAVESGRYFTSHREHFDSASRVDAVLLSNLLQTRKQLIREGLEAGKAQALLIQVTFIAYLEDRGFLDEASFKEAAGAEVTSLRSLLDRKDPLLLGQLFAHLRADFNGDLFLAPCSFDGSQETGSLTRRHLAPVAEFRHGLVEMDTGQRRFWPYDFRYIPVELISALYDRFLAEDCDRQRASGAYYTPRPLVDFALDQAWRLQSPEAARRSPFRLLDPACGSGIFLVRAFQRLVERRRHEVGERYLPWSALTALLENLHGWDVEPGAIRLAVFSLCVALLEEADPAEVKRRLRRGPVLPRLYRKTLRESDVFSEESSPERFDLVLGNPPWVSRKSADTESARRWCRKRGRPMPGGEMAWAFVWKAHDDLVRQDGLVAFLLPAMGFLFNQAQATVKGRRAWLREVRLRRVINLSDLRFQLFDGAIRPTVFCAFQPSGDLDHNYKLDYWCPKADRHLQTTGVITLPSQDRMTLSLATVLEDSSVWKRRMWMRNPEMKLCQWLATLPRLGSKLATYRESRTKSFARSPKPWIIGQGFQPAGVEEIGDEDFKPKHSKRVEELPFLESTRFQKWALLDVGPETFGNAPLRRTGFEDGFDGPHVLLLQGTEHGTGRLQATYSEQSLTFRDSIQAIRFPAVDAANMKLLTAVLNSGLSAWLLFHEAANPGAERSKAHEAELLELPFATLDELEAGSEERHAADKIVEVMDELLLARNEALFAAKLKDAEECFDRLVYQYYALSEDDIAVVEEALTYIIPSAQPRRNHEPPLWRPSSEEDWRQYFHSLSKAVGNWLAGDVGIGGEIAGSSQDLVILRLWLGDPLPEKSFVADCGDQQLREVLTRLRESLPRGESQNFQLLPDLRVFLDDELFLVKPRAMRFWLRSTAFDDADAIVGYLFAQAQESRPARRIA